jgi:hypothetical protein
MEFFENIMFIRGHPSFRGVYDMPKRAVLFQYLSMAPLIAATPLDLMMLGWQPN